MEIKEITGFLDAHNIKYNIGKNGSIEIDDLCSLNKDLIESEKWKCFWKLASCFFIYMGSISSSAETKWIIQKKQ